MDKRNMNTTTLYPKRHTTSLYPKRPTFAIPTCFHMPFPFPPYFMLCKWRVYSSITNIKTNTKRIGARIFPPYILYQTKVSVTTDWIFSLFHCSLYPTSII